MTRRRVLFAPVASTPEQAARPSLYAATCSGLDNGTLIGPTGLIGIKGVPGPRKVPAALADEAIGLRVWEASERLTAVRYLLNRRAAPAGDQ
ncbi:hypothetical protein Aple_077520 [Acrocarpospora pleiomorpha]|uniref:Uncharacterized protein n=1 Tax=Acrocarpospora pleiomorpha TaxID=90975 RepID=A0A5M3XZG1_9ACTN|nr:hypothetical protein [Acrocarpospora pleiomorpha]GES24853.1 hypothetical protein Aple_077520 [Acrocarpospora pleiomorpha]